MLSWRQYIIALLLWKSPLPSLPRESYVVVYEHKHLQGEKHFRVDAGTEKKNVLNLNNSIVSLQSVLDGFDYVGAHSPLLPVCPMQLPAKIHRLGNTASTRSSCCSGSCFCASL